MLRIIFKLMVRMGVRVRPSAGQDWLAWMSVCDWAYGWVSYYPHFSLTSASTPSCSPSPKPSILSSTRYVSHDDFFVTYGNVCFNFITDFLVKEFGDSVHKTSWRVKGGEKTIGKNLIRTFPSIPIHSRPGWDELYIWSLSSVTWFLVQGKKNLALE